MQEEEEKCVLCSPFSVQQTGARHMAVSNQMRSDHIRLVYCRNCGKAQCYKCCTYLYDSIKKMSLQRKLNQEDKTSISCNTWMKSMGDLVSHDSSFSDVYISYGTCCQFKASIPTPRPKPDIIFKKTKGMSRKRKLIDSDDEYLPERCINKKLTKSIKGRKIDGNNRLNFLYEYHTETLTSHFSKKVPPLCPKVINEKRKSLGKKSKIHSRYLGALVLQQFGLVLLAEADNNNLRTDIMVLAKCSDSQFKSPAVYHHGVDLDDSLEYEERMGGKRLKKIPKAWREKPILLECPSPEDPEKCRLWKVETICLPQIVKTDIARLKRGLKSEDNFSSFYEFGQEDLNDEVDICIIIGNFMKEEGGQPKLLCLKFGKMLYGKISEEEAHSLFCYLQLIAGKGGYELRRKDGSAGVTNSQSDINLLAVLPYLHSAVPRKLWGTFILRLKYCYYIFYKRAFHTSSAKSAWTHVWYTPPHNGGKFKMPESMIIDFPCLGEFSYQKMLAVTIMQSVNKHRLKLDLSPIAPIETCSELQNIMKARKNFDPGVKSSMIDFVHAYNNLNDFNTITHVVGSHEDYSPYGPSFENRMLVVNTKLNGYGYGRGGGIFTDRYTWSLVDWNSNKNSYQENSKSEQNQNVLN